MALCLLFFSDITLNGRLLADSSSFSRVTEDSIRVRSSIAGMENGSKIKTARLC